MDFKIQSRYLEFKTRIRRYRRPIDGSMESYTKIVATDVEGQKFPLRELLRRSHLPNYHDIRESMDRPCEIGFESSRHYVIPVAEQPL